MESGERSPQKGPQQEDPAGGKEGVGLVLAGSES